MIVVVVVVVVAVAVAVVAVVVVMIKIIIYLLKQISYLHSCHPPYSQYDELGQANPIV